MGGDSTPAIASIFVFAGNSAGRYRYLTMKEQFTFFLILATLGISLLTPAVSSNDSGTSAPNLTTDSGDADARAPLHQPPSRPPPPKDPHEQRPQLLGYGQCELGTNSSTIVCATQHADTARLYADFGLPAICTGEVVRWEFCYTVMSMGPADINGQNSITMVVLRPDVQTQFFHVINVHEINVAVSTDRRELNKEYPTFCDFIDSVDVSIIINQGDLLGFVCGERIRILFTSAPQGQSSCRNTLRAYNISTQRATNGMASALSGVDVIQTDQFDWVNQPVTPLVRVILNTVNTTTMTSDSPVTTALPTLHPTKAGKGNITDILTSTIFLSVVAVLLAVILFLFILVLILSSCLCQVRYRCYGLRDFYSRCCLCCQQRNQVVHRVKVEPLSLEQSMQYNELYIPSNTNQRLKVERGNLHKNPAYSAGVDEIDRARGNGVSEGTRGLEHTYEMIETLH